MGLWEQHRANKTEKQAWSLLDADEALLEHALGSAPGGTYLVAAGDHALYILRVNGLRDVTRLPYETIASASLADSVLRLTTRSGSTISITLQHRAAALHAAIARQSAARSPRLVS